MSPALSGVPEPMAALDEITIHENGELLVDIRTYCPKVTIRKKEGNYPYLRKTTADMLNQAANTIPEPYHLHVISALRSLKRQSQIWQEQYEKQKKLHPDWPENILCKCINKYVAPVDRSAPPGHCTGAAIDVVLQKANGNFVDLIPPLENWTLGHTWNEDIDKKVRRPRAILIASMLAAGFSNCRDEYWHYSWGDSAWAVRVGKTTCCYGAIEPPE